MTTATLATLLLVTILVLAVWDVIQPNAYTVKYHSGPRLAAAVVAAVAMIVLLFTVAGASTVAVGAGVGAYGLLIAIKVALEA